MVVRSQESEDNDNNDDNDDNDHNDDNDDNYNMIKKGILICPYSRYCRF